MKRLLLIFFLFMLAGIKIHAQEDDDSGNEKIRDKMNEFIQQRLNLTKSEAEKFSPVFLRYFKEWRTTMRDSKADPVLVRQQKIVDLGVRYRYQFKGIIGEKRGTEVFDRQKEFIDIIRKLKDDRMLKPERNNTLPRKNR